MRPDNPLNRRNFIRQTALLSAAMPFASFEHHEKSTLHKAALSGEVAFTPEIYIFSKHLQFLNYSEMAQAAADMGFDGVDLTVRPGGHVLPERVETDLPKAVSAIQSAGLKPLLMTTAIESAENATDLKVLETAAPLGIKYYRMNWYNYLEDKSIPESIKHYQQQLKKLSQLNKKLSLTGCYQNHAGERMGASIWELWDMIKLTDHTHMGVQYDIRHATVEGGLSWKNGLRLIHPYIKTVVIKDFKWTKQDGKWQVQNTPLGEGMVDFPAYFSLLKKYKIQVPFCLHMEYDLGGAEKGNDNLSVQPQVVFDSMKRDLQTLKTMWQSAS